MFAKEEIDDIPLYTKRNSKPEYIFSALHQKRRELLEKHSF